MLPVCLSRLSVLGWQNGVLNSISTKKEVKCQDWAYLLSPSAETYVMYLMRKKPDLMLGSACGYMYLYGSVCMKVRMFMFMYMDRYDAMSSS